MYPLPQGHCDTQQVQGQGALVEEARTKLENGIDVGLKRDEIICDSPSSTEHSPLHIPLLAPLLRTQIAGGLGFVD